MGEWWRWVGASHTLYFRDKKESNNNAIVVGLIIILQFIVITKSVISFDM